MRDRLIADRKYNLWINFTRVYHLLAKLRKLESLKFQILPVQSYILFVIKYLGNETSPAELGQYVYQQPSAISDILNRMEKQDLIKKTKKTNAKGRVIVKITKKGENALRQSANRELLNKVFSTLSDDELKQLEVSLDKLRDGAINELTLAKKNSKLYNISKYYLNKKLL